MNKRRLSFFSPNVAKVLVENFGIGGITNVEDDMAMFGIEVEEELRAEAV